MCPHHGTRHLRLGTCSPVVPAILECPPVPQEPKTQGVPLHLSMLGHAGALWMCWGMLGVMDLLVCLYMHAGMSICAGVAIHACWHVHTCWCGCTCMLVCAYTSVHACWHVC